MRTIAKDLNETSLLMKIQGGDFIALESKYHLGCLAKLRNRHRCTMNEERKMEARAFAELLSHIETSVQEGTFLFKFSELRALYERRLSYFGIPKEIVQFKSKYLHTFLKLKLKVMAKTHSWFLIKECNRY